MQKVRLLMVVLVLVLVLGACGPATPDTLRVDGCEAGTATAAVATTAVVLPATDDPYVALLTQYNWTPQGEPTVMTLEVPQRESLEPPGELPYVLLLEASQAIGLDFRPWAGQTLELRHYALGREPRANKNVQGHLLTTDRRVVGAWLSVELMTPGIYPLDTPPEDLVPQPC